MITVFSEYGKTMLTIISFGLVVVLLFANVHYGDKYGQKAVLNEVATVEGETIDKEQVTTADEAVLSEKRQPVPVIIASGSFETGETYDVNTEFNSETGEQFASVRVLGIQKIRNDGSEVPVTEYVLQDNNKVCFPASYSGVTNEKTGRDEAGKGTYQIRLCVVDSKGKQQTSTICVGVEKGGRS